MLQAEAGLPRAAKVKAVSEDEAGGGSDSDTQAGERCAAHPGTRNDVWCGTCEAAICERCAGGAGHAGHSVDRMAAAYDDTFEAVEAMQVELVRRLGETRQRSALLDAAAAELAAAHGEARAAVERQAAAAAAAVDQAHAAARGRLQARVDECREWRGGLEETLRTVQLMVEELAAPQMVARRGRILALLGAVERARPGDWWAPLPRATPALAGLAQPAWHYAALHVPAALELGRRRGHVRAAGDPFSAHGMVWRAEARRTRGALGDPCLAVAVTCVAGCETAAYAVSVDVASAAGAPRLRPAAAAAALDGGGDDDDDGAPRLFRHEDHGHAWRAQAEREFAVCALDELEAAGALDAAGGVTVRVGVRPGSFREAARVQQERIRALEDQARAQRPPDALDPPAGHSARAPRRRRGSSSSGADGARGWATSPRAQQSRLRPRVPAEPPLCREWARQSSQPAIPLWPSPPESLGAAARRRANSGQAQGPPLLRLTRPPSPPPKQDHHRHRSPEKDPAAADHLKLGPPRLSLLSPPRTGSPSPPRLGSLSPPRFGSLGPVFRSGLNINPLGPSRLASLQINPLARVASSNCSQVSMAQSQPEFSRPQAEGAKPAGVLRRLSGWVRTTEGRVSQQARRAVRAAARQGAPGEQDGDGDGIGDWTMLDGTLSPGFCRLGTGGPAASPTAAIRRRCRPPSIPLPPVPPAAAAAAAASAEAEAALAEAEADGFDFDGMADIEREQAAVDARALAGAAALRPDDDDAAAAAAGLQARYDSIVQRVDALQLIANTVENSRDGFSEGTLRRISSELGVLRDDRIRRVVEARAALGGAVLPRPLTADSAAAGSARPAGLRKKAVTIAAADRPPSTPAALAAALERLDVGAGRYRSAAPAGLARSVVWPGSPPPYDSDDDDDDDDAGLAWPGSPRPPEIQGARPRAQTASPPMQPAPPALVAARRSSISIDAVCSPGSAQRQRQLQITLPPQPLPPQLTPQLTPQATRRAGVLKAGQTKRVVLARPAPPADGGPDPHAGDGPGDLSDGLCARPAGRRQPRAARKRVRFPEEQRLLETIRLIDPAAAQSLETRGALPAPPPPPPPIPPPLDLDDVFSAPASPEDFASATSLLLLPPQPAGCQQSCGADVVSDAYASGEDSDAASPACYEDAAGYEQTTSAGLPPLPPRPILLLHTNARGQAVGPNVGSAQSSPAADALTLGAANCSPSPPPPAELAPVAH
ncbi:hypothetical protein H4R18_002696 [Coemansia javaensis]|uniref:B box-type domain-containing protein n=1 Tax=Coemansia javaensis TaxID=2761396 RepID=A0A9W8LID0_9FUNG|nr:hypothetical protein H4R18_002696 [Coemansia javaensis]